MTSDRPAIQQVIPGYQLLAKIGQGGMGAVYRARQESMDRIVALKILPKSLARRSEFKERFFREARAAGKLNHPNIVSAYDAQEANGYCYIAMEFVEGETVAAKLKREGALAEEEAIHIAHQIAAGLAHAWKNGIVHRDVKPENFLYTKERIAKLCDLGIAKVPADANLTQDGIALGTPRYISPEQARGIADLDYRTDIYSLGASLYHMIAGVPPFDGPTPAAIMLAHVNDPLPPLRSRAPHASKFTAQVVERMMAKEPDNRYASAEDFIADMEAIWRGEAPPIAGAVKRPSVRRVVQPRRASASRPAATSGNFGGIVALAGIAAVLMLAVIFWPSATPTSPSASASSSDFDKEDRALELLRQAREAARNSDLQKALLSYQQLIADYADTKIALLAKDEMAKAQQALAERDAKNRREREAAQAWQALKKERDSLPPLEYRKRAQAFAEEWRNTSSAAEALAEADRIEKEETKKAAAKEAEKKAETPEERRQRFIAEARQMLSAGQDLEKVVRVLDVVDRWGPALATLAPEISRLARTGGRAELRCRSLAALSKAAPPEAAKTASALLADRNERVRLEAIRILREQKDKSAAPWLQRLAEGAGPDVPADPSPRVRSAAREALKALAQ